MRSHRHVHHLLLVWVVFVTCLLLNVVRPAFGLSTSSKSSSRISFDALQNKQVLIVGGSGRVGGSVVTQLVKRGARVVVGGTSAENFCQAQTRWQNQFSAHAAALQDIQFIKVNREDASSFSSDVLSQCDLVIHTAGPFQGKVGTANGVLQACVEAAVPYLDVCDDYCTARAAKTKYMEAATSNKVPCILSTGTWPGVSSLMAKQLVEKAVAQYPKLLTPADLAVDFGFFTAGSGGAGVTLLVATFLILAEQALTVVHGRRQTVPPLQDFVPAQFGNIVGTKYIAPLNLLETASIHDVLGVGSTSSKFGTAPGVWNALLGAFGTYCPPAILENEDIMRKLSLFSMPIVRLVDALAGATNAIRVDVRVAKKGLIEDDNDTEITDDGSNKGPPLATAIYAHENLEPCVGECIVAFAAALLAGRVAPGVWFPEEAIRKDLDAAAVLGLASVGAHTTTVETPGQRLDVTRDQVFGSMSSSTVQQQQQEVPSQ